MNLLLYKFKLKLFIIYYKDYKILQVLLYLILLEL